LRRSAVSQVVWGLSVATNKSVSAKFARELGTHKRCPYGALALTSGHVTVGDSFRVRRIQSIGNLNRQVQQGVGL
jgi:hypothetical protein